MCYLLQSLCLAWTGLQDTPSMMPGMTVKKHLQQINGIHRGSSGDGQSSARITALSSALCCLLRVGRGQALLQVAGRLQAHYHPCSPFALHLQISCFPSACLLLGGQMRGSFRPLLLWPDKIDSSQLSLGIHGKIILLFQA